MRVFLKNFSSILTTVGRYNSRKGLTIRGSEGCSKICLRTADTKTTESWTGHKSISIETDSYNLIIILTINNIKIKFYLCEGLTSYRVSLNIHFFSFTFPHIRHTISILCRIFHNSWDPSCHQQESWFTCSEISSIV